jgi:pimeloyl-ACP methyl ester carboxylesterase
MKSILIAIVVVFQVASALGQTPSVQVEKSGKGTPVIYLPGFGCPGRIWKETAAFLGKGYSSHFVTYAGFDGTTAIDTPWYSAVRDGLVDYIKSQQLKKVYVVGHSMGGNLATDLAALLPDRVTKVVLVDAIPCMREVMMPGVKAEQIQYISPYNKQLLEMQAEPFKKMAAAMSANMTSSKEKTDTITSWMVKADRKVYVFGYTDLLKLDLRPVLPSVKAPVLILGAGFPNREMIEKNYNKQYEALSNKEILIADKSRHFIMFDEFEWMVRNIQQYFSK